MKSKEIANYLSELILQKKGTNIKILELKKLTPVSDYFVICSGDSTTQVKAIADNIETKLREKGIKPIGKEGFKQAHWVLIDYGDVVVHVFETETRDYYELEKFWLDAPRIPVNAEGKANLGRKDKRTVSVRGN